MARNKVTDGEMTFVNGQNSSLAPDSLLPGTYCRGMNVVNRGGVIQCRPGYRCLSALPDGVLQGGAIFRPRRGQAVLLFGVAGLLYISEAPFRTYTQVPDVQFSPTASQLYFKQVIQTAVNNEDGSIRLINPKSLMVIQDGGTSPAVLFDGSHGVAQTSETGIPSGGPMEWICDRLWVARGARLYASDIANPTSFTEPLYFATARSFLLSGNITGMSRGPAQAFAQLLVFTETTTTLFQAGIRNRELWAVTPDFQKEILPDIGCVSDRSITTHFGYLWWYSQHGLTNLDAAAQAFVSSEITYTDGEMQDSKARLGSDKSSIACATFENYFICSVPHADKFNSHTWILDNLSMVGSQQRTAPVWNSVWTGTRPVQWLTGSINGVARALYFSVDYDGVNRLWEAFTPDRLDDGCPITWWAELRATTFQMPGLLKEFRYSRLFTSEISGVFDVAVFWAGSSRGKYKNILTKRINAGDGFFQPDSVITADTQIFALKKQSRPLTTQDGRALIADTTLSSCDIEAPNEEFRDESFQLLIVGSGPGALRGYINYAEPPTNTDDSGGGFLKTANETENNFVRFDGGASEVLEDLAEQLPVFTSVRTETLSQAGFTEVATGQAESIISQDDADKIATAIARRKAAKRLEDLVPRIVSMGEAANDSL